MKVIYLHQYFNTPRMSGGTRSFEMARRMVSLGHEVHMITSYREKDAKLKDWFQTNEAGINVHWYPVPYSNQMGFIQRMKAFISFAFAARKRAVEVEGDIVFATSTPLTIALPAVPAARKKRIPLVFEVRDLWPEMPIAIGALNNPLLIFAARKLEYWAYRNSEAVVALSPGMKDGVVNTGYPVSRVAVIPNSSDNDEFGCDPEIGLRFRAERTWIGSRPLLVYTGTFGKVNGISYMVHLAKELLKIDSDILIYLVGQGAERNSVLQLAKQEGVYEKNLFFDEAIPKSDMPALLSAATIASNIVIDLPEARANSANKFFDTLAAGKPVFLNHGGWMHELVKEHKCGLPVWGKSVVDVAFELDEKMHDNDWLKKAGIAARQLAEDRFARDDLAQQLMSVLEAVIDGCPDKAEQIAPGNYISEP